MGVSGESHGSIGKSHWSFGEVLWEYRGLTNSNSTGFLNRIDYLLLTHAIVLLGEVFVIDCCDIL